MEDPDTLVAPEHLGWLIKRIQHAHHRALDAALSCQGVSLVQWNALREIERNPGCSQHQLAERTFNSDQSFGALLTRLEAARLIQRSATIGRSRLPQLTPEGTVQLRKGHKVMSKVVGASFNALDNDERHTLSVLLTKVLATRM